MTIWIAASYVMSLALFVLPFKRPQGELGAVRPARSLWAVAQREAKWTRGAKLKVNVLRLGFVASLLVVFLPPMILVQLDRLAVTGEAWLRAVVIVQSIALVPGCALSLLAIVLSDLVIGFGTMIRRSRLTMVAFLIPLYELGFALGGFIGAVAL